MRQRADCGNDRLAFGPRRRHCAKAAGGWDKAKNVNGRRRDTAVDTTCAEWTSMAGEDLIIAS